jgi:hypothetical protein
MTLINGLKSSPLNSAKSNPIGGFFIKTDAAGETKVYLTGSYSVQDYRAMPDIMQSIGSPDDQSHVVKKTPHASHYELWKKCYGVGAQLNRITIGLDDNLAELTEGLEHLRDKKFVSQHFMDSVLRAVQLCSNKEIGNKELQIECQQINTDIQKDLPRGKH